MSKNSLRHLIGPDLRRRLRRRALWLLPLSLVLFSACRQDMQDQPKYIPLRASKFFVNGSSARPLVEGTVPRGFLHENKALYTGKKEGVIVAPIAPVPVASAGATGTPAVNGAALYPDMVTEMPLPVDQKLLDRGQERFQIFCSVCHGYTGYGDGMLWRRGYKKPASLQSEQLRQVPVGHIFDVITNGWGVMPSYASQIPVGDRWAVVAYVRALQLSQQNATPPAEPFPTPAPSPAASPATTPKAPTRPAASAKNGGR